MLAATAAMTVTAFAQNEEIHVYRSDATKMTTVKAADIVSFTHEDGTAATGFNNVVIKTTDGATTEIAISAIDSVQVSATGLPEVYVTLTDPQYADLTDLITSLGKSYVYQANLRIDGNGMIADMPEQHVEFRGRGNSTWNMPKKPYRFKMDSKASLGGMKKAKTFALIANWIDNTLMRNTVALWVANWLEMPYANHCVPVKVYLNGNYKGAYMMTEKIGIGGGSVDIDENTGLLFELDSNYDEDYCFYYTWNGNQLPVMVKDPDLNEISTALGTTATEYFNQWKADFTTMADAVVNTPADGSLKDYIDLESAANFFIVNSLAANHEMQHPKSFYMYKEALGTEAKYHFGPVWDFDWAFTYDGGENASPTRPMVAQNGDKSGYSFIKALFSNNEFRAIYKEKWDNFVTNGYPLLKNYMEEYAATIEPSAIENGVLWPANHDVSWRPTEGSVEFRKNYNKLKTWIQNRITYCNSHSNFGVYE